MAISIFGASHDAAPSLGAPGSDIFLGATPPPDEAQQSLYYQTESTPPSALSSEYLPASQTDPRSSTTSSNLENIAQILTDANLSDKSPSSNNFHFNAFDIQDDEKKVSAGVDDALMYLDPNFGADDDEFDHHVSHVNDAWDGPELEDTNDDGSRDMKDDDSDILEGVSDEKEEQGFSNDETSGAHYKFRRAPRERDIQFSGAYIDKDDSGNYDPKERSRPAPFRARLVVADRGDDSDQDTERRPRPTISWAKARKEGISFEVTLKLNCPKGKKLMTKLRSTKPDNWPDEPWNFLVGNPPEQEAAELDSKSQYLLRSDIARLRQETEKVERHENHQHRQGFDYTGHPEGRGCKACRALHETCSLLDPQGEYPCLTCEEDDCECELLLEPKIKRGCNSCDRGTCSYLDGGDHSKPCLQCQHAGYTCIAGPAVSLTRVRLMDDGRPAFTVEELKKISQKTSRRSKKRKAVVEALDPASINRLKGSRNRFSSSNTAASLTRSQKNCRLDQIIKETKRVPNIYGPQVPQMMGIPAAKPRLYVPGKPQSSLGGGFSKNKRFFSGGRPLFTKPARIPLSKAALEAQRIEALEARMTEPVVQKAPSFVVKTIQTKLAHPITFNAPTTASKPCHFHTQSCMPLIGYGTTRARVHAWPSGAGYTEIPNGGGHTAQGCEPTRICSECTSARLAICLCSKHNIRAIPKEERSDKNEKSYDDVNNFLDRILTASTEEEIRDVHGMCCSICPRLAHWNCVGEASKEGAEAGSPGCGLRLCTICYFTLKEVFHGNLQEMIDGMDSGEEFFPLGLRADAEFFKADGLLMRHLTMGN